MSEWTWLFARYPEADIELMGAPFDAATANVLVRTVRIEPGPDGVRATVRVAPHNAAPFRGGPWLHTFAESELLDPGPALAAFRQALYEAVEAAKRRR
ncbi:MAG: hypothetical protein K6T78_02785 [Alicyclobacillus sp.]|nr:hypothetical protein [Alicyclobacillus sp.]